MCSVRPDWPSCSALPLAAVRAQTAPVGVPDKSFPESVSSTKDGTLYVGSFNLGGVVKAAPGGKAEQFIQPGAGGSRSVLGVLADEKSGTLYVCSNDITGFGVPGPGDTKGAWLKTFDLASGAPKGSFALKRSEIAVQRHCRRRRRHRLCHRLVHAQCLQPEAGRHRARGLGNGSAARAGQGWRRPRRHRGRVGRQSLCHDLYPGEAVQDRSQGRQGRRGHRVEIVPDAGPCGCDAHIR